MSSKHASLVQQLAQLDQPAPLDFDPEDEPDANDPEDANEQHTKAGREHYLDVGPSALRKLQDKISDPKYEGVRISRKKLEDDDDDELSEDVPDAANEPMTSEGEDEEEDDEDNEDGDAEEEAPKVQSRRNTASEAVSNKGPAPKADGELSLTLKHTREEERKKGKAVARQLTLYDSLLDARIRLQKCVMYMNMLPDASKIPDYLLSVESRDATNKMLSETMGLADDLFELQEKLMTTNESLDPPSRKRRKIDDESDAGHDWEEELQENSAYFAELESTLHPHLLTTLQKWSNKVLAIAPSTLLPSSRTKFSRNNANQVKSAVQLVDDALLDREKLVARTRIWRGKGSRLGVVNVEKSSETNVRVHESADGDMDVFDDTDYYQSLLRDVIDARAGGSGAGAGGGLDGLAEDWRAAQKQRKARKAVDTRASKGRKLRFEVHEKLQNFMAPAPPPGGAVWHEAQIDELFASLFGKGFSIAEKEVDVLMEESLPRMDVDMEQALKGGFRVFG
ncbi:TRAUB-domain-containing protein [Phellopilus nigrolimitatus]|nr:TRAUB-domain-containing protein [Phellopilus nigrolimitatus]